MAILPLGIRFVRDTAANWSANNPTLGLGQPGFETDTNKLKVGNGTSNWSSLPYIGGDAESSFTFENGLTELSGVVKLGGAMTESIDISGEYPFSIGDGGVGVTNIVLYTESQSTDASAGIQISPDSYIQLYMTDGAGAESSYFTMNTTSIIIQASDPAFVGAQYDADYSANFTDRSLVDKAYVDSVAGGGSIYTFENGLTELSGNVKIGGSLTENTTLSGAYDVTFTDLTGFSAITSDAGGSTGIQLINPNGSGGFQIYHGAAADFQIVSSGSATSFDIGHYGSGSMTITDGSTSDFTIQKNAGSGGALTIQKNGGSDPFTIANNGDGDMIIEKNSADGVFEITQNASGGLQIKNTGEGGISIENDNTGLMNIVSGGGIVLENISGGPTNIINTSDAGDLTLKGQTADTTKQFSIVINGNYGIVVDDTEAQHGLKYQSDYSLTYDDRSLVDKAYVDSVASGGFGYTAEDTANKSTSTSLGASDTLYPSQKAVKTYVDNAVSGITSNVTIATLSSTTTLDATYAGKTIECTGTFTITLPNSMSTGMSVTIVNVSTGVITLAASTTLSTKGSYTKLASQYGAATTYHRGSNVWVAFGDLTP